MQQPFDSAAREALEATGLLTAEEITLIIHKGHYVLVPPPRRSALFQIRLAV